MTDLSNDVNTIIYICIFSVQVIFLSNSKKTDTTRNPDLQNEKQVHINRPSIVKCRN